MDNSEALRLLTKKIMDLRQREDQAAKKRDFRALRKIANQLRQAYEESIKLGAKVE